MPILITCFLLLAARADEGADHPAEDGIQLSVIMAARLHTKAEFRPFQSGRNRPKRGEYSRTSGIRQLIFQHFFDIIGYAKVRRAQSSLSKITCAIQRGYDDMRNGEPPFLGDPPSKTIKNQPGRLTTIINC